MIVTELLIFMCLFIVLGLIIPHVKTINSILGYRTHRAMKNQRNWEFAQKFSGKGFVYLGIGTGIYSGISYLLPTYSHLLNKLYFLPMIIVLGIIIYKTEQGLKKLEQQS
ncbi:SdpI family protein [Myroides sp. M-43]|uniref:SdpI family protein n=1 Tax=Myroides oncorhynchi TaxID=2893756 RepID=UPI001E5D58C8|nr:SdpI family protein [Myroides oncorhynchi]MCC9042934.1 SdpI family protein [Myroides oncorhynchi]